MAILDHTGRPVSSERNGYHDGYALPHVFTMGSIAGGAYKTYLTNRHDEAYRKSRETALSMRRDCNLMGLLQERKLAVASLKWHLEVDNEEDLLQKAVKDKLTSIVRATPDLHGLIMTLLEGIWYGRYASHVKYEWKDIANVRALAVKQHRPISGDKITYKYDGTPCIQVYGAADEQDIEGGEFEFGTESKILPLYGSWRERFIIYTHECEDADYFDYERADAIHGIGIRDRLAWMDWLKREGWAVIWDHLETVGMGISVWYYNASNPKAKTETLKAAKKQTRRSVLLVPVWGEGRAGQGQIGGVDRIETPTSASEFMFKMIEYIDGLQERYVVGQSLSSDHTGSGGLGGSGAAEFQETTKAKITKSDAERTQGHLTRDWLDVVRFWTFSGLADFPVRWVFDVEDEKSGEKLEAVSKAVSIGVDFVKNEVRALTGLSDPKPGDDTVGGEQAQGPIGPDGEPMPVGPNQGGEDDGGQDDDGTSQLRSKERFARRGHPLRYESLRHKYCSTQFNLEGEIADRVRDFAESIPDGELAEDGREEDPHITVKFGLHVESPEAVEWIASHVQPFTVRLGKTSLFKKEGEHDVIKIDVESPQLHRLNSLISGLMECTDTHPTYRPHVTIAYLKPGKGGKYSGDGFADGVEVYCDRLIFSDKDRKQTVVRLGQPFRLSKRGSPLRFAVEGKKKSSGKGGSGRWVTIGAKEGADGKKHGGSPVYIEDGKITKGHPKLTGMRVEALKEPNPFERLRAFPDIRPDAANPGKFLAKALDREGRLIAQGESREDLEDRMREMLRPRHQLIPGDPESHRKQLQQSREYERAVWGKKARQEGIDPKHLHSLAAEIIAHDEGFNADRVKVLKEARRLSKALGYGSLQALAANDARGARDASSVKGLDDVAELVSGMAPHLFPENDNAAEVLYGLLVGGNPEAVDEGSAYQQAFDLLAERRDAEQAERDQYRVEDDEPIPFSRTSQLRSTPARYNFDESKVGRDEGGRFAHKGEAAVGRMKNHYAGREAATDRRQWGQDRKALVEEGRELIRQGSKEMRRHAAEHISRAVSDSVGGSIFGDGKTAKRLGREVVKNFLLDHLPAFSQDVSAGLAKGLRGAEVDYERIVSDALEKNFGSAEAADSIRYELTAVVRDRLDAAYHSSLIGVPEAQKVWAGADAAKNEFQRLFPGVEVQGVNPRLQWVYNPHHLPESYATAITKQVSPVADKIQAEIKDRLRGAFLTSQLRSKEGPEKYAAFDESQHPRADDGKFTRGPGVGPGSGAAKRAPSHFNDDVGGGAGGRTRPREWQESKRKETKADFAGRLEGAKKDPFRAEALIEGVADSKHLKPWDKQELIVSAVTGWNHHAKEGEAFDHSGEFVDKEGRKVAFLADSKGVASDGTRFRLREPARQFQEWKDSGSPVAFQVVHYTGYDHSAGLYFLPGIPAEGGVDLRKAKDSWDPESPGQPIFVHAIDDLRKLANSQTRAEVNKTIKKILKSVDSEVLSRHIAEARNRHMRKAMSIYTQHADDLELLKRMVAEAEARKAGK